MLSLSLGKTGQSAQPQSKAALVFQDHPGIQVCRGCVGRDGEWEHMGVVSWLHNGGLTHCVLPGSHNPLMCSSPTPNSKQTTHRQEVAVVCSSVLSGTPDTC